MMLNGDRPFAFVYVLLLAGLSIVTVMTLFGVSPRTGLNRPRFDALVVVAVHVIPCSELALVVDQALILVVAMVHQAVPLVALQVIGIRVAVVLAIIVFFVKVVIFVFVDEA